MGQSDLFLVKEAYIEFDRWVDFLSHRPYKTEVVAEFIDEIEEAFVQIQEHPERFPLETNSVYRKFGPTKKHRFKVIYTHTGKENVDRGDCPSRAPNPLLGKTTITQLKPRTLANFPDRYCCTDHFFLPINGLFQAVIEDLTGQRRTR